MTRSLGQRGEVCTDTAPAWSGTAPAQEALRRFPQLRVAAIHDVPRLDGRYRDAAGRRGRPKTETRAGTAVSGEKGSWRFMRIFEGVMLRPLVCVCPPPTLNSQSSSAFLFLYLAVICGIGNYSLLSCFVSRTHPPQIHTCKWC